MAIRDSDNGEKHSGIDRRKFFQFGALVPATVAATGIGSAVLVSTGHAQQSQTIFDLALEKEGLSKSFVMKSYIGFGAKSDYADVEIVIDRDFMHDFNITSRREYEALVQYTLQYDSKVLNEISQCPARNELSDFNQL
jgi:hypothetical protein